jgi:hypothetical protein
LSKLRNIGEANSNEPFLVSENVESESLLFTLYEVDVSGDSLFLVTSGEFT